MKKVIIPILVAIFFAFGCAENQASDDLTWETNLEKAIEIAKTENKAVLINFTGSDWCKWCKKLNAEVFSQKEFADYAKENLVLVKLDFPRSIPQSNETKMYNQTLAQKYGVRGFPTILIMNSQGQLVAKTGYQPGGAVNYINHIKSFL